MKSVEKTLSAVNNPKSERVSAPRERPSVEDAPSSAGYRQTTAPSSPVSTGFKGQRAPLGETEQTTGDGGAESVDIDSDLVLPIPGESPPGEVNPHLVTLLQPRSGAAENYYRLRHQLEVSRPPDTALVVGVTSPGQGDGKTLTAINLAGALARGAESRVLLLDLNLRRKDEGIAEYLGITLSKFWGLADWAQQEDGDIESFIHYLEPYNLHVLTAGSEPEDPYELLKSRKLDGLMERAREHFDFVIVDAPQILRLPDTELISRLIDGFLIVVKAAHTRQTRLEEALDLMEQDQVLGLVLNATKNGV